MMKGDKIKLKKKIGTFGHIGAICEVTDVSEDGVICFRWGKTKQNIGCISECGLTKYFTEVRNWTEWKPIPDNAKLQRYITPDAWNMDYKYRTNGKIVQVKYDKYVGTATCHKGDNFDLYTGLLLAKIRTVIKQYQGEINDVIDTMEMNDMCEKYIVS